MLPDIVRRVDRRQPACRSALPQAAFLPRKNSAGLFGEGKSDDDKEENRRNTCVFQGSMTQSALICTVEKRVCPCQTKVFPRNTYSTKSVQLQSTDIPNIDIYFSAYLQNRHTRLAIFRTK